MKQSRYAFAALVAVAGASFAIGSLATNPGAHDDGRKDDGAKRKDEIVAAVDTLEAQLQRRFHDRNALEFGYSRVARPVGHRGIVATARGILTVKREDGKPVQTRGSGPTMEYEVEDGVWIKVTDLKQTFNAENDDEAAAVKTLRGTGVALYTGGAFDAKTGTPLRLKGPAYLRQTAPIAPEASSLAKIVAQGWKSDSEASEFRQGDWTFRVVKVKADDQSCLNCHRDAMAPPPSGEAPALVPLKLNDPIGTFVIATKR